MPPRKTTDPFTDTEIKDTPITDTTPEGGEITLTWKQSATTGAPWVIFKGTPAEAVEFIEDAPRVRALFDGVHGAGKYFSELAPAAPAASGGSGGAVTVNTTPQGSPGEPFPGPAKMCKHGEMQKRTGTKNGRTWKAYMCPTPQGTADQCSPEFLR